MMPVREMGLLLLFVFGVGMVVLNTKQEKINAFCFVLWVGFVVALLFGIILEAIGNIVRLVMGGG